MARLTQANLASKNDIAALFKKADFDDNIAARNRGRKTRGN